MWKLPGIIYVNRAEIRDFKIMAKKNKSWSNYSTRNIDTESNVNYPPSELQQTRYAL